MTDIRDRQIAEAAIARLMARRGGSSGHSPQVASGQAPPLRHPSHAEFVLPAGDESGGACLIEPAVLCTHCGFCKACGH